VLPNTQKSSILLTGATGFLGGALLRKILASQRSVIAVVRPNSQINRLSDVINNSNFKLVGREPEQLEDVFRCGDISVIIHTATEYGRGESTIADILEANLILPIRIAELGVKYGARGFINTDSYFNKKGRSYSNLMNYSLSKQTLLVWLEKISTDINIANMSLEHMYGPYDSRAKFVEAMIQAIAIEQQPSVKLTHGHQKRDFIYLDDVVESYMYVLMEIESQNFKYINFEIGSGSSVTVKDFVTLISKVSGSPTQLDFGSIDYRDDEIMSSKADIRGICGLGWSPKTTPIEGITKILKKYKITQNGKGF